MVVVASSAEWKSRPPHRDLWRLPKAEPEGLWMTFERNGARIFERDRVQIPGRWHLLRDDKKVSGKNMSVQTVKKY